MVHEGGDERLREAMLGIQRSKTRATPGKDPASPSPKRKRMTRSETSPVARPVAAVRSDHQRTMRASIQRGPKRSMSQPLGTSKSA
jgi:hypothetical protein